MPNGGDSRAHGQKHGSHNMVETATLPDSIPPHCIVWNIWSGRLVAPLARRVRLM